MVLSIRKNKGLSLKSCVAKIPENTKKIRVTRPGDKNYICVFLRKILDISSLFSVILTEKDYGIDTNIQYGDLLTVRNQGNKVCANRRS